MPGVVAAAKVAGRAAGRGPAAAGASATAKTAGLPRDPGRHVAKLRGQGRNDDDIRKTLRDMGYDDATTKNVVPGAARPQARPAPTQSAVVDAPDDEPAAELEPEPMSSHTKDFSVRSRQLPTMPSVPGNVAGFALGLLGTAVLINFMRGGPAEVSRWAQAKFLNKVTSAPPAPATPGSSGRPALPGAGAPVPGAPRYPLVPLPGRAPSSANGDSGFAPGAGAGGGGGGSWP